VFCAAPWAAPGSEDLIYINIQPDEGTDVTAMSQRSLPPIRHCPLCSIAMQASKSDESLPAFDIFRCMNCDSAIRETPSRPPSRRRPGSTES
jgi:hypothetical protein